MLLVLEKVENNSLESKVIEEVALEETIVYKTEEEKIDPTKYIEVHFNSKYFDFQLKSMNEYLMRNSKSYLKF